MKSVAKANGRNLDGILYSMFQTTYRVHSQAMPSKFITFVFAILFIIKLKFLRNKNIYELIL